MNVCITRKKPLSEDLPNLLKTLRIEVVTDAFSLKKARELLNAHHYLGGS
jgi:hypothetical protein